MDLYERHRQADAWKERREIENLAQWEEERKDLPLTAQDAWHARQRAYLLVWAEMRAPGSTVKPPRKE